MSRYFKKFKKYAFRSFAVVLSAALAVTACCFSSGLTAHAANSTKTYEWVSASPSGGPSWKFHYLKQTDNLFPDHYTSISIGDAKWCNYYRSNLVFDLYMSETQNIGKYINGCFWIKFDYVTGFSHTKYYPTTTFMCPDFSSNGASWTLYQQDEDTCYMIVYFDHYQILDERIAGPSDWIVEFSNSAVSTQSMGTFTLQNVQGSNSASLSSTSDLASQIALAINSSADIDTIIALLTGIRSNTALLSSVLTKLDNINGVLANIYSEAQAGNASLNLLISALAGVDVSGLSFSAVQIAMYNNWVNIIRDAINKNAPDTSGVSDKQQSANDQLTTNDQLESQAFDFADNNISAIDFNIASPGSVASSAVVVMSWLTLIWDKLGNLQFLVTATCLAGLLTIVLGVINRFIFTSKRD